MSVELIEYTLAGSSKEELERIRDKKVDFVHEYLGDSSPLCNRYMGWRGTTEEEFFSIVFVNGMLTVTVEEREMLLGSRMFIAACSKQFVEEAQKDKRSLVYLHSYYSDELKEIEFGDVMKILNWEMVAGKEGKIERAIDFN